MSCLPMKALLGPLIVMLSATTALAHPGWGIVQDSRGNVFFTDTRQVWKITPDGRVSVAVANVHTHELCVDAGDNLYGEHLWYEGDATGKWGHRVWRLRPDGTVGDVIPARAGFRTDYSFVRDREGTMYWADRGAVTVIRKRSPAGNISTHAAADFRSVERMTVASDGTLYLMDAGNLRRVSAEGKVATVATAVSGKGRPPVEVGRLNYHMGLWIDRDTRVYVAAAAERLVLRVDGSGKVSVVARSAEPWAPSGGMIDRDGSLWILEYDSANSVRVRRIDRAGKERVFSPVEGLQAQDDARGIIERAVKAAGGGEFKAVHAKYKGTAFINGVRAPCTLEAWFQLPHQLKTVLSYEYLGNRDTLIQVVNGDKAWRHESGRTQEAAGHVLQELKQSLHVQRVEALAPLLKDQRYALSRLGETSVSDQPAVGVNVTLEGHVDVKLYFDRRTGFLLKSEHWLPDLTGRNVFRESYFTDFKEIDGVKQPTRVIIHQDGTKVLDVEAIELRFPDRIEASVFKKP